MVNIINVGGKKRARKNRRWLRVVFAAVLILIAGGGAYVGLIMKPWQPTASDMQPAESDYSYNKVAGNLNDSTYTQAIEQLTDDATQTDNTNDKIYAYFQQFSLAMKMEKYDDALRYAELADKVRSYSETSSVIAQSYAGKGDKQQAISYYKKAISQLDLSTEFGRTDARTYNAAIAALEE